MVPRFHSAPAAVPVADGVACPEGRNGSLRRGRLLCVQFVAAPSRASGQPRGPKLATLAGNVFRRAVELLSGVQTFLGRFRGACRPGEAKVAQLAFCIYFAAWRSFLGLPQLPRRTLGPTILSLVVPGCPSTSWEQAGTTRGPLRGAGEPLAVARKCKHFVSILLCRGAPPACPSCRDGAWVR